MPIKHIMSMAMLAEAYLATANALPAKSCSSRENKQLFETEITGACRNRPNLFTL